MTADLYERLRAAITQRLRLAEAATPGPWRVAAEGSEGSRVAPDHQDKRERTRFIAMVNCTGSAHLAGEHWRCTNPRHVRKETPMKHEHDGRTIIRDAIVEFRWSNYGLGEVPDADPEYADHLATKIVEALRAAPNLPSPRRATMPIADPEIRAMSTISAVLDKLDDKARVRVLEWVLDRFEPDDDEPAQQVWPPRDAEVTP
jgi:hypothetical protein